MSINGIPGAYNSYGAYRATNRSAPKVSVSEDGLFEPRPLQGRVRQQAAYRLYSHDEYANETVCFPGSGKTHFPSVRRNQRP